jgi:small-conductance mechanosensitive channel
MEKEPAEVPKLNSFRIFPLPFSIPYWAFGTVAMIVWAAVLLVAYRWFMRRLARLVGRKSPFLRDLLLRAQGPASALVAIFGLATVLPAAGLPASLTNAVGHALVIAFVLSVGWAAAKALDLAAEIYLRRLGSGARDNLQARKHVTQVHILRRATKVVLVIVTVSAALMTIEQVREYGLSLFASAGAAGLVLGLAARPVLSNLLAGIQIAITQPIRVEDVVIVEGEWGWIETITSTYVVVRIWDLRRLILPLTYFIEKPFQNWTYVAPDLLGTVYLNVDFTVPAEEVRRELEAIARASKLWDGKAVGLQVTDAPGNMVQLRALVSAANSGDLWNLRCEVREKLIAFLQARYPNALPRQRAEITGTFAAAARQSAPPALSASGNRGKRPALRRRGA